MTDRELLELAAKAAGKDSRLLPFDLNDWTWNPLRDDGDALRLAIRLNMRVQSNGDDHWQTPNCTVVLFGEQSRLTQPHVAGSLADTRRAIVRAAAEIGKGEVTPNALAQADAACGVSPGAMGSTT